MGFQTAAPLASDPASLRAEWCQWADRLAEPILTALDKRELRATMPVELAPHSDNADNQYWRRAAAHLEALGRLLAGLAPWLELGGDDSPEGQLRERLAAAARRAIDAATDPASPDRMNFSRKAANQPLVDAAFLAQAIFRAPRELWEKLEPRVRANLTACFKETRTIPCPTGNNWVCFSGFVELVLELGGVPRDEGRLLVAIEKHREWYVGDGTYSDGAEYHWDYYNAYVIQPMLRGILDVVAHEQSELSEFRERAIERTRRYAVVQERMVSPDGSFPVLGRSIVYRCGALQVLADVALRRELPESVPPAAARIALTRAIRRTLGAPGTFDKQGWLRLGLAGHQPSLAESYISTGSLYLCSVALLPLGLPPSDPFWNDAAVPTTWERIWGGEDAPADSAYHE